MCYTSTMQQINLKSDKVATLIEKIVAQTGESKVEAVAKALEERLQDLEAKSNSERTLAWLETSVWKHKAKAPSKEEQENLLGF